MDALQLGKVIGVGNVHRAEIFCAESCQALFGDGNVDFFDAIDMGDLRENLFFVRIEREDGEILGVEDAEDIFA